MTEIDKIIQTAQTDAYEAWRSGSNRDAYIGQGFAAAAAFAATRVEHHLRAEFGKRAAAIEARVRAEVAEEIAVKIEMNVRNPDLDKQDRGGWWGFAPKMAYIAGHDNAAKIARLAAGSSPDTTPEARDV